MILIMLASPASIATVPIATYALELHAHYVRELKLGQGYRITTQLLDGDNKRLHFFHHMYHDAEREEDRYLAATFEGISMHIDRTGPRGAPFPPAMAGMCRTSWLRTRHCSDHRKQAP